MREPDILAPSAAVRLVEELGRRGVELRAVAGELKIRAPRGTLDAALRERLRELKPELLRLLGAAPLTGAQRQLWFVEQVEGRAGLELILRLRLRGELDRAALGRALAALVTRHEALRTRFELDAAGEPVQVVGPPPAEEWTWSELAARPELDGRPFVASLRHVREAEHELVLRVHHIVCDGWSMAVLVEDLGALYSSIRQGRAPRLPALTTGPSALG